MYLKQIATKYIQNHREVVIDMPPTGLVVFTGENSNGKSVIVRTTRYLVTDLIQRPRKRAALVNREMSYGEIKYTRSDGVVLLAHIQREASGTYISYSVPGEEPIVRYLADKSYRELISRFGWHYDKETGITLNIAEAEESLLFYKTPYKSNRSVIETANTDISANTAVEHLEEFVSSTRKWRESYSSQLRTYLQAAQELKVEDTKPLAAKLEVLQRCKRNLSVVYFPTIPDIQPVPKVHYVTPYIPELPKIRYPRIVSVDLTLPDIVPVAKELESFKNLTCPTCGRRLDEHACEDIVLE